ncbi:hypothetical protein pb186bvf_019587 [Paramecium bursaria]
MRTGLNFTKSALFLLNLIRVLVYCLVIGNLVIKEASVDLLVNTDVFLVLSVFSASDNLISYMIKLWQKTFVRSIYFYSSDSDIELVQKPLQLLTNPTNDELTLLISDNIHPLDTIKIYKQYQSYFKSEHYLQAIKTITVSRTSLKFLGNQQVYTNLHQMCSKLLDSLDEMDIHQCMEFFHSVNRFTGFQTSQKLVRRIQQIQDYSQFNLTQIIKLAQDMYQINMNMTDIFNNIILRCVNDEASIFDLAYLLKMEYFYQFSLQISQRENIIKFFDYLHSKVSYFDIEFQSYFLLLFANRRYYDHFLIIPKLLYVIEKSLQQKIHKMNEQSIINILQAYKSLPKFFPQDLLNIIQEMFIKTINQSPQQLEVNFLKEIYFTLNLSAEEKNKICQLVKEKAQQQTIKQNLIPHLIAMNMKDIAEIILSQQQYNQDTLLYYKMFFDQNVDRYVESIEFQDTFKKYLAMSIQNPEKAKIREQLLSQCNQKTYKWITKIHHFEFDHQDLDDFILRMSLLIRDKSDDHLQKLFQSYKIGKKIITLIRNQQILDIWIEITSKYQVTYFIEDFENPNQFQVKFIKHTIYQNIKTLDISQLKILLLLIKPQDFIDDSEFLFKIMKRLEQENTCMELITRITGSTKFIKKNCLYYTNKQIVMLN